MSKNIKEVDGIRVVFKTEEDWLDNSELRVYIKRFKDTHNKNMQLHTIIVSDKTDDDVCLEYLYSTPKFVRLRRISGYLVDGLERGNDAKRAELDDRVKHEVC